MLGWARRGSVSSTQLVWREEGDKPGRQARETSQGENGGATTTPTVIITELYQLSRGYVRTQADGMCYVYTTGEVAKLWVEVVSSQSRQAVQTRL